MLQQLSRFYREWQRHLGFFYVFRDLDNPLSLQNICDSFQRFPLEILPESVQNNWFVTHVFWSYKSYNSSRQKNAFLRFATGNSSNIMIINQMLQLEPLDSFFTFRQRNCRACLLFVSLLQESLPKFTHFPVCFAVMFRYMLQQPPLLYILKKSSMTCHLPCITKQRQIGAFSV